MLQAYSNIQSESTLTILETHFRKPNVNHDSFSSKLPRNASYGCSEERRPRKIAPQVKYYMRDRHLPAMDSAQRPDWVVIQLTECCARRKFFSFNLLRKKVCLSNLKIEPTFDSQFITVLKICSQVITVLKNLQ
jgi:hypothetical protein